MALSDINLANYVRMAVASGGTGDLTLEAVDGYPDLVETIGLSEIFTYAIVTPSGLPLESGKAQLTTGNVLQRISIHDQMGADGEYIGSPSSAKNIPLGSLVITPMTKALMFELLTEATSSGDTTRNVVDLGNVSGTVEINMQLGQAFKLNATGNVILNFTSPTVLNRYLPVTVFATRTTLSGATVTIQQPINYVANSSTPDLQDYKTTVFTVVTLNGGTSYFGFSNGIVYDVAASPDGVRWNPDDRAAQIVLSDNNKTAEFPKPSSGAIRVGVRALPLKSVGKWMFALNTQAVPDVNAGGIFLGLATTQAALNNPAFAVYMELSRPASTTLAYRAVASPPSGMTVSNSTPPNVVTQTFTWAINTVFHVLVDFDNGKVWFLRNGVCLNPTATTTQDILNGLRPNFTFTKNANWAPLYPIIYMYGAAGSPGAYSGRYTLLSESEDVIGDVFSSQFSYWG